MNQKVAVIFWSGTGNTEAMAQAVAEGAKEAGAAVSVLTVGETTPADAAAFDALALGCPAMGAEVLEEYEFEPFFAELEGLIANKSVGLFGSYGWGDGQWMRDWAERTEGTGAVLVNEGVMANNEPDEDALAECKALGAALVNA